MRKGWLALALMAAMGAGAAHAADVQVGAIEILSGPNAPYGISIKAGLELALAEVNRTAPAGKQIDLTVLDSGGQKNQAMDAARTLIGRDHVVSIIGPTLSNEMFAVGPITNGRGIPTIGTSTTAPGITQIGPNIFRTSLPESQVVPVTIAAAKARGVKTIALMYADDDAFSKGSYQAMAAAAKQGGLDIIDTETFGSHDTDFSGQLTKIKGLHPDAVGIAALVEPTAGVLLQAHQLGFPAKTLFIGGNGANSPKLGQIAGVAANGLIVGTPWFVGKDTPQNKKFVSDYKAKYSREPDQFAAQAYDTMFILARAIDAAPSPTPADIRKALQGVHYDGVMGPFSFTSGRDPASAAGVLVLQMENGAFRILPPA